MDMRGANGSRDGKSGWLVHTAVDLMALRCPTQRCHVVRRGSRLRLRIRHFSTHIRLCMYIALCSVVE